MAKNLMNNDPEVIQKIEHYINQESHKNSEYDKKRLARLKSLRRLTNVCISLIIENNMFDRYMERIGYNTFYAVGANETVSPGQRIRSRVFSPVPESTNFPYGGKVTRLSAKRKCEIAQYEQVEFKKDLSQLMVSCGTILDGFKASIEKFRILEEEVLRERKLFDKTVAVIVNDPKQRHDGHRAFLWFHQAYLKRMDVSLQNMLHENEGFRLTHKKLVKQLKERESRGETVNAIDVEELQIKCHVRHRKLKHLRLRCVQAKTIANSCTHLYDIQKKRLDKAMVESEELKRATRRRVFMTQKLEERVKDSIDVKFAAMDNVRTMQSKLENFVVPTTHDFLQSVLEQRRLDKEIAMNNRKLRLAKLRLDKHKRIWADLNQNNDSR